MILQFMRHPMICVFPKEKKVADSERIIEAGIKDNTLLLVHWQKVLKKIKQTTLTDGVEKVEEKEEWVDEINSRYMKRANLLHLLLFRYFPILLLLFFVPSSLTFALSPLYVLAISATVLLFTSFYFCNPFFQLNTLTASTIIFAIAVVLGILYKLFLGLSWIFAAAFFATFLKIVFAAAGMMTIVYEVLNYKNKDEAWYNWGDGQLYRFKPVLNSKKLTITVAVATVIIIIKSFF